MTAEEERLEQARKRLAHWKRWGPYVSARAWGTVREDYSPDGSAWAYLPHDHARSKAYRWNEDGLAGVCDRHQVLCLALAVWNGRDPILKERPFGLAGPEGNHGEDVKEYYFYLDATPTHSYLKYLYKYPQAEFPYGRLVAGGRRSRAEPELELLETGVFEGGRYFDVFVEYAKGAPDDLLVRVTAVNRGPEAAELHLLPTIWFRNTWSWGREPDTPKPNLEPATSSAAATIQAWCERYGFRWLYCDAVSPDDGPELLFTENETNAERLFGAPNPSPYVKDAFHEYVVRGRREAVNPELRGTKAAAYYRGGVPPGGSRTVRLRLTDAEPARSGSGDGGFPFGAEFDETFEAREREADAFYMRYAPRDSSLDARAVQRQAFAGLLWNKQYYHYTVREWLEGDPAQPEPPRERFAGRNSEWQHLYASEVLSIPDNWEFPWFAAWDLAFHCIPLALVDADFAKEQLVLMLREWYMHPNGQLPAYEWAFGDVNPPVHAWACRRVYQIERRLTGHADRDFLERVFHKLLLNFTWWVNRKDREGNNVFEGGFLGLDNIGAFDRNMDLPDGEFVEQADGTSWMAMYCLNMLAIALELALHDRAYEDVASKFLEHFLYIAHAMNHLGSGRRREEGIGLWDEEDGFFYDVQHMSDGSHRMLKVRSMVGLIPLFAVETIEPQVIEQLPGFRKRLEWFINYRKDLRQNVASMRRPGTAERRLLSVLDRKRLVRVLRVMLDEAEFLSPHGVRSLSRAHRDRPYVLEVAGGRHRLEYEPGESATTMFGGNSNWRGPVWFPVNYLLIESLQKYDYYYGSRVRVEFPTGSGELMTLWDVSQELSRRLTRIFLRHPGDRLGWAGRPVFGDNEVLQRDPQWRDYIPFHEYFHGDTGAGLGAAHQTGWTALVAKLIEQSGE
jgi:hypothetical protein